MSRQEEPMTPAERDVRAALQAAEPPPADPAFRDRLARAFADGTIARGRFSDLAAAPETGGDDEAVAAAPVSKPATIVRGPWRRVRRVALAAAALAAAVLVVSGLNFGPDWTVVEDGVAAQVVIDDRAVPSLDAGELAKRLRRGGRLRVEGGPLVLMAGPDLMIEITPGTEATLPPAPNRWWARTARARIETGECRITTGPGFRGASLAIATPEAAVQVIGTTLAVIREPMGTCVCVFEGSVMVGRGAADMAPVTGGNRRFVFGDGRPVEDAPIRPAEIGKLQMFRERRAREAVR